jgi:GNAT superfamily N-acetyltransferase
MRTRQSPFEERPNGYPLQYERDVRLTDGRTVRVRPIVPEDAPELARAIRTADAETLRLRFLGGTPPLTNAVLTRLTCVDYVHRFALVAFSEEQGVAIARYEALPPTTDGTLTAEIAVAVAPEWRHVGLATVLIGQLAHRAQECGITHLSALFSAGNRPVAELARDAHARILIKDGAAQLDIPLDPRHAIWTRNVDAGADRS